jgi:hypothetical protein
VVALQVGSACCSWRLPPPRWLGGDVSVKACEKLVPCSGEGFVRGTVLTPWEPQRATLVERVIELSSLVGRFLRCPTCGLGG